MSLRKVGIAGQSENSSNAEIHLLARCPSIFSSITIELNLKNDRLIYLPHRQSAIRVKYLSVTFENKCDVCSIAIELEVDVQYIRSGINIV